MVMGPSFGQIALRIMSDTINVHVADIQVECKNM